MESYIFHHFWRCVSSSSSVSVMMSHVTLWLHFDFTVKRLLLSKKNQDFNALVSTIEPRSVSRNNNYIYIINNFICPANGKIYKNMSDQCSCGLGLLILTSSAYKNTRTPFGLLNKVLCKKTKQSLFKQSFIQSMKYICTFSTNVACLCCGSI